MNPADQVSLARGRRGAGAVAAGSIATAKAMAATLRAGGNAVDAVLAGTVAASVGELGVSSLGGGGFLIVRRPTGEVLLRDFFVDTPGRGLPAELLDLHFLPMEVTFPGSVQTFHVGMGSVAVPGLLAGILEAHREFARLPLRDVVGPAQWYATHGVPLEAQQAVILRLTRALVEVSPESAALIRDGEHYLTAGDLVHNHDLARFLSLVADGRVTSLSSPPFAEPLLAAMAAGGLVTAADLEQYEVRGHQPETVERGGHLVYTNASPSFGGPIIASTLASAPQLDDADPASWPGFLQSLVAATAAGRSGQPLVVRGTTHVSAVDSDGMVAALTSSNGVTSGFVIPGTGIQLNNMLGEADLNPEGFHAAPPGQRLGSMMSPTVMVDPQGSVVALGTGGSERIRSALSQVLARMIDLGQPLDVAISGGRIHPNEDGLQVEPRFAPEVLAALAGAGLGPVNVWDHIDLFFGGVNAVQMHADGSVLAVADSRRGGCALIA